MEKNDHRSKKAASERATTRRIFRMKARPSCNCQWWQVSFFPRMSCTELVQIGDLNFLCDGLLDLIGLLYGKIYSSQYCLPAPVFSAADETFVPDSDIWTSVTNTIQSVMAIQFESA